jgi:hypothetical protein
MTGCKDRSRSRPQEHSGPDHHRPQISPTIGAAISPMNCDFRLARVALNFFIFSDCVYSATGLSRRKRDGCNASTTRQNESRRKPGSRSKTESACGHSRCGSTLLKKEWANYPRPSIPLVRSSTLGQADASVFTTHLKRGPSVWWKLVILFLLLQVPLGILVGFCIDDPTDETEIPTHDPQ